MFLTLLTFSYFFATKQKNSWKETLFFGYLVFLIDKK